MKKRLRVTPDEFNTLSFIRNFEYVDSIFTLIRIEDNSNGDDSISQYSRLSIDRPPDFIYTENLNIKYWKETLSDKENKRLFIRLFLKFAEAITSSLEEEENSYFYIYDVSKEIAEAYPQPGLESYLYERGVLFSKEIRKIKDKSFLFQFIFVLSHPFFDRDIIFKPRN